MPAGQYRSLTGAEYKRRLSGKLAAEGRCQCGRPVTRFKQCLTCRSIKAAWSQRQRAAQKATA